MTTRQKDIAINMLQRRQWKLLTANSMFDSLRALWVCTRCPPQVGTMIGTKDHTHYPGVKCGIHPTLYRFTTNVTAVNRRNVYSKP
jgi:hypothetical protein